MGEKHPVEDKGPIVAWKNFRFSLELYTDKSLNRFVEFGERELSEWEKLIKGKLNDQLDPQYYGKKRPDVSRPFPWKNSGNQVSTFKAKLKHQVTGEGNMSITGRVDIKAPYAMMTDMGKPARKPPQAVAWAGWVQDTLYNNSNGRIKSVSDVFDELVTHAKAIRMGLE